MPCSISYNRNKTQASSYLVSSQQTRGTRPSVANCTQAVVYLKNRVNKGWASGDEQPVPNPIPEDVKHPFRERLLPILASSPPNIRIQLVPILQKVLQYDFPAKWPNFMDLTMQLLGTQDANSVFAGLQCVLSICRTYRFKAGENRDDFNKIVEHAFDQVLGIGTRLVDETSLEAGEMLRLVIKSYKHAIYVCGTLQRVRDCSWLTQTV
jgi:hypothetical protein